MNDAHRTSSWLALFLSFGVPTLGCNSRDDAGDVTRVDVVPNLLCETCVAGGETTDFGGEPAPCSEDRRFPIELDAPGARELGAEGFPLALEGRFRRTLRWETLPGAGPTSGPLTETEVIVEIRLAKVERVELEPTSNCEPVLEYTLAVQLEAVDGSIVSSFEAPFRNPTQGFLRIDVPRLDLRLFGGTLELPIDAQRPHDGYVDVELLFYQSELRGHFAPTVRYLDDGQTSTLVVGHFPADACGSTSFPLNLQQELTSHRADSNASLGSAIEVFEREQRLMDSSAPSGTWGDGTSTDIRASLEQLRAVCTTEWRYELHSTLRLQTTDQRLNVVSPVTIGFDAESPDSFVYLRTAPAKPAAFEQLTGVRGVDFEGDEEAVLIIEALQYPEQPERFEGAVEVVGFKGRQGVTRDFLSWCPDAGCQSHFMPSHGSEPGPEGPNDMFFSPEVRVSTYPELASGNGVADVPEPRRTQLESACPFDEDQRWEQTTEPAVRALAGRWLYCSATSAFGAREVGIALHEDGSFALLMDEGQGIVEADAAEARGSWSPISIGTGGGTIMGLGISLSTWNSGIAVLHTWLSTDATEPGDARQLVLQLYDEDQLWVRDVR